MSDYKHSPMEEQRIREAALDETLAGTFPASDPPSSIPNPNQHDAASETLAPRVDGPPADAESFEMKHARVEAQPTMLAALPSPEAAQ
jgi:hypothetical protein